MKIKVIYPVRPEWREHERREYEVGEVEAEDALTACEMMFAGFNNVINFNDIDENPSEGDLGFYSNKFNIRSMSVGDIVEVDGVPYRCMNTGFEQVDEEVSAGMGLV
jgi:hypothetical protein